MSKVSVFDQGWIDLVFEGRNHEYGAYQMRKDDAKTTMMAFITGIGIMALLVGISVLIVNLRKDIPVVIPYELPGPVVIELDNSKTFVEPKKPETKPEQAAAPPAAANPTTRFTQPVATSQPVPEPIPTTGQLQQTNPGSVTTPGNPGGDPLGTATTSSTSGTGTGIGTSPTGTGIETSLSVDKMPEFPGGLDAFYRQVGNKFNIPEMEMSRTFKVYVSFVVETDGTMSNIKVGRDPGYGLGEEAIRVLKSIKTKWKPGQKKGQAVRTAYNLPITVNIK